MVWSYCSIIYVIFYLLQAACIWSSSCFAPQQLRQVSFVKVYPAAPAAGVAHGKADASHVFQFYTGSQAIVRKARGA